MLEVVVMATPFHWLRDLVGLSNDLRRREAKRRRQPRNRALLQLTRLEDRMAPAILPPAMGLAFNPSSIPLYDTSNLNFTITNPAGNTTPETGVAVTDILPVGLTAANGRFPVGGGGMVTVGDLITTPSNPAASTESLGVTFTFPGGTVSNEIPVVSYAWGGMGSPSGNGGAWTPALQDFQLRLSPDLAEPDLPGLLARGSIFPQVTLRGREAVADQAFQYLTYTLSNVQVTGYATGSGGPDLLTLKFDTIAETSRQPKPDGSVEAEVTVSYPGTPAVTAIPAQAGTPVADATEALGLTFTLGSDGKESVELPVVSYGWGAARPQEAATPQAAVQPFQVTLGPGVAEPDLWALLASGQAIPQVTLRGRQAVADNTFEYLTYTLTNVKVVGYQTGSGGPDLLTLSFDTITETIADPKKDGSVDAKETASYDAANGRVHGLRTMISLSGATIEAGTPLPFSVVVTGVDSGKYTNTTGPVTSTNGGQGNTATASILVGGITGEVFNDLTGAGAFVAGDPGLEGWTIDLLDASGAIVATQVTDATGSYSFTDPGPGTYTVQEEPLNSGWIQTFPAPPGTYSFTTTGGGKTGLDFGDFQLVTLLGTVYNDLSGNGVNDFDPGLKGWTVNLLDSMGDTVATTTSAEDGRYSFANLGPGIYTVADVGQDGWLQTEPQVPPGTYTVQAVSSTNPGGLDFGHFQRVSVSGTVYNDLNGDGQRDAGEPGLQGWPVNVLDTNNTVVAHATSGDGGDYTISGLGRGSFTLAVVAPGGWLQTQPANPGYYSFTTSSGVNVVGGFFGSFHVAPPVISTMFGAPSIPLNGTTTLTFTITNLNSPTGLTGVGFTDNLPAGLVVADPPNVSNGCGGTLTAVAGTGTISLVRGILAAGGNGTITVQVRGTTAGTKVNTTSPVQSAEGGAGNAASASVRVDGAPVMDAVSISPPGPTTNQVLSAVVRGHDDDGDSVSYAYRWYKNDSPILLATASTLDLSRAGNGDRGDRITVRVTAGDGTLTSAPLTSDPVTVQDSAPVVDAVAIRPDSPRTNDLLTATVRSHDDDGDPVLCTYQWYKNGVPIPGAAADTLDLSRPGNGDRGDQITVQVTASDGTLGTVFTSAPVTVQDSAPVMTVPGPQIAYEDVDKAITGVSVADADGDSLTVTVAVGHGTLTLGTTTHLKVTGYGSGRVTLFGAVNDLNAALKSLAYRDSLNYGGPDTLSLTANDGSVGASASVALTVKSAAQQAADLRAQVNALRDAHVLSDTQAQTLNALLDLKGNVGDIGRVRVFLTTVTLYRRLRVLTQAQADALLGPGNTLLLSVTRR
jgi:type VI protein secretion system component Hcp